MAAPSVALHPRAAPGDRLRVWVGAFDHRRIPTLSWRLDGAASTPTPVAAIESVRHVERGWALSEEPRSFAGVYEFTGVAPGPHVVDVATDGGLTGRLEARPVPLRVPEGPGTSFNVLLASCFHGSEDPAGLAGIAVSRLPRSHRPDLSLLLGDQVYLDLPFGTRFPRSATGLSRMFEPQYVANWRDPKAYSSVIGAAPSVSIPDDHEYWNNFPHRATVVPTTWTDGGRDEWRPVAERLFARFQAPDPEDLATPFTLDVDPLSFFVVDSRTFRWRDRRRSIAPEALKALAAWVDRVVRDDLYGVIATGQSYFEEAAGFLGRFTDWKLPNYKDFDPQVAEILRLAFEGRNPVITITGDVHWGRLLTARSARTSGPLIHEVIASPTSLVADPRNAWKKARHAIGGLFGGDDDPWYLHNEAAKPPKRFGVADRPDRRMAPIRRWGQKGNHIAILAFRRTGMGLEMEVSFWPLFGPSKPLRPDHVEAILLRRRL